MGSSVSITTLKVPRFVINFKAYRYYLNEEACFSKSTEGNSWWHLIPTNVNFVATVQKLIGSNPVRFSGKLNFFYSNDEVPHHTAT